jgi:hypothetical protein
MRPYPVPVAVLTVLLPGYDRVCVPPVPSPQTEVYAVELKMLYCSVFAPEVIVRGVYVDELPFDRATTNAGSVSTNLTHCTVTVMVLVLAVGDVAL